MYFMNSSVIRVVFQLLHAVVFDTVEEYAPGFKKLIVDKEVLTPPDLERIFGLTGGVSLLACVAIMRSL